MPLDPAVFIRCGRCGAKLGDVMPKSDAVPFAEASLWKVTKCGCPEEGGDWYDEFTCPACQKKR